MAARPEKSSDYGILSLAGGIAKRVMHPVEGLDFGRMTHELVAGILAKASQQKDVLIEVAGKEISRFLQRINVGEELKSLMRDTEVEVHAVLNFRRKGGTELASVERRFTVAAPATRRGRRKLKK